jgi:hypothetical protein
MPLNKAGMAARDNGSLLKFADRSQSSQIAAKELLHEIDNLAVLLHEVKRQTDRIEAAADAIGDAILNRLDTARVTAMSGARPPRRTLSMQPKVSARLRTILPRLSEITDIQS